MGDIEKFSNMKKTLDGSPRAYVSLDSLKTLWFNTGTLCNLECKNCYIESSPRNDRLSYINVEDISPYLKEIKEDNLGTELIGLTGGEPFLNPSIIPIIETILAYGHDLLILTNANRVIKRYEGNLLKIKEKYGDKLHIRVSLDHFSEILHDEERGKGSFNKAIEQLRWLSDNNFNISIASRMLIEETTEESIKGHDSLLKAHGIKLDLENKLVIFPEMKSGKEVPEITTACWEILDIRPKDQMCASERMIVKRKGDKNPVTMPCTLLAYDENFILGNDLKNSEKDVYLNHKFCSEFCVLGKSSCSSTK